MQRSVTRRHQPRHIHMRPQHPTRSLNLETMPDHHTPRRHTVRHRTGIRLRGTPRDTTDNNPAIAEPAHSNLPVSRQRRRRTNTQRPRDNHRSRPERNHRRTRARMTPGRRRAARDETGTRSHGHDGTVSCGLTNPGRKLVGGSGYSPGSRSRKRALVSGTKEVGHGGNRFRCR